MIFSKIDHSVPEYGEVSRCSPNGGLKTGSRSFTTKLATVSQWHSSSEHCTVQFHKIITDIVYQKITVALPKLYETTKNKPNESLKI